MASLNRSYQNYELLSELVNVLFDQQTKPGYAASELKLDFGFALNRIDIKTRMRVLFNLIDWKEGDLFLDCGCGVGPLSKVLTDRGKNIVGIDIEPRAVKVASSQIKRASFLVADATHLPFRDEIFSNVVCSAVLEHIPDDRKAFSEMQRILKSSGELAITTPRQRHSESDARFLKRVEEKFGHVREGYTVDQIKFLVKNERLQILKVKLYWGPFHWLMLNLFERMPQTAKNSLARRTSSGEEETMKKALRSQVFHSMIFFLTMVSYLDDIPFPSSHRFGLAVLMKKT